MGNVYFSDSFKGVIGKLAAATGTMTTLAAGFVVPKGLALDGAGNLYEDYEPTYISWSTTTCRSRPHEHAIHSAGRPAAPAHSAV
jgi:hypothetical protein